jgi:hypothetical protein
VPGLLGIECPKVLHRLPHPATLNPNGSRTLFKQRHENYLPVSPSGDKKRPVPENRDARS